MIAGVTLILAAAVLQGAFLLPMSRVRGWDWEHVWLVFSLTGMLFGNWILTLLVLPHPLAIFAGVPWREDVILAGLAWPGVQGQSCSAWQWIAWGSPSGTRSSWA